ncbi:hypothetical protein CRUP_020409 [Coryphaenoides rupestris]|nr:hypothetical protein CRUP_020409 [Coryphaenoides rupestris]
MVLLVRWLHHVQVRNKIEKARRRRESSLLQAERRVCEYSDSHPDADDSVIRSLSARQLTQSLQEGSLLPEDVFFSYLRKTLEANERLNCCTEVMMTSLDHLKSIDSHKDGLLYGVPVSIKDNIDCKGYESTCGLPVRLDRPVLEDSVVVEVLRRQGAIPFVKTNVPQGLLKDVDSLALCMQALLSDHMFTLDPTVPPIPFNTEVYQSSKPLRIGFYENDGYHHPSPSMLRGVRDVKALLESAGHTLVAFKPLKLEYAMHELFQKALLADKGATLLQDFKGSPIDPALSFQVGLLRMPCALKKFLSILLAPVEYIQETIGEWRRCGLDVLLCPVIGPAFNHKYSSKLPVALSTTVLYNLLNFPAGVVPVGTVTPEDELQLKTFKGNYQDISDKNFKQAVTGGVGLPVAVQCVALPWQEELCLRFMREVETLVRESAQ